jgi:succinyl-CoA synthetase beta subunit
MAKFHQTENPLYKALVKQYESEIASAVATLIVYFDNPTGAHLKEMDEKSGASLKLTILNPEGRIWTLVAGGGASVVYADTVADLGYVQELANYGEYSGNPSRTARTCP